MRREVTGAYHPCRITAISESGVELAFDTEVPPPCSSQLQWTTASTLPVKLLQIKSIRQLDWGKWCSSTA